MKRLNETEKSEPTRPKTDFFKNFSYFLLLCLIIGIVSAKFPFIAAISIPALILILSSLIFPFKIFLVFFVLLFSLGDYFGSYPLVISGFKFYGADFFLVLLIILIILLIKKNNLTYKSPISTLLLLFFLFGVISILIGLFYQNHEFNRTIGDFRRFFYYPLAFFLGLNIIQDKKDIIKFEKTLSFIPVIIIIIATCRVISGVSWAPKIHTNAEDFRAMAYYDGIALIFIFSYLISLFFLKKKLNKFQLMIAALIPIYLILSGFRLIWGLFFLAVMLIIWLKSKKYKKGNFLRNYIPILIIIILSIISFRIIGGNYYEAVKSKVLDKILHYTHSSERWRYPAWETALNKFFESPIIGTGLGDIPTFWAQNSAGQWAQQTHTIHNAFLEILSQTGIIGIILFLLIISRHGLYIYKNIKNVDLESLPIISAFFILFICGLIQSFFQPYLNHPGNSVIFFSSMGITIKFIELSKNTKSE